MHKDNKTKNIASFKIRPHFEAEFEHLVSAHILPKLTGSIPSIKLKEHNWPHLQGLQLVDKDFTSPGVIDIILGADVYAQIIENGFVNSADCPIAQQTKLGWILSGLLVAKYYLRLLKAHISLDTEFYDLLHRFWELEEIPSFITSSRSPEEQECELHFSSTHTRDEQGRYIVRLPFKHPVEKLGNSRSKAMRMISTLSRKLDNISNYSKLYFEFMNEYERLQHMIRVPDSKPEPSFAYYLPHHGVVRENSLTNKLRVSMDQVVLIQGSR